MIIWLNSKNRKIEKSTISSQSLYERHKILQLTGFILFSSAYQ